MPDASTDCTPRKVNTRRPHHKTRTGCLGCKRRKVKCDEISPRCSNCIRFDLPCERPQKTTPDAPVAAPIAKRPRGRPRKDRTASAPSTTTRSTSITLSSSLNVAHFELFMHYITSTAPSLTQDDGPDEALANFWAYNVPQIGLAHPYVLQLCLALAGYHLARLHGHESDRQRNYAAQAGNHLQEGLAEYTKSLPSLNDSNCGALYSSSILVFWCTFAAGPTGPGDLLICDIDNQNPCRLVPLMRGIRSFRETIPLTTLFSGLMELGQRTKSSFLVLGDGVRVDWKPPLGDLRRLVESTKGADACVPAFHHLEGIYKATLGAWESSDYDPNDRYLFAWLYHMEDRFAACVQRKQPVSLLLLAYYAVLLRYMSSTWYIPGWPEHLVSRVSDLVGSEFTPWLEWPMGQIMQKPASNNNT